MRDSDEKDQKMSLTKTRKGTEYGAAAEHCAGRAPVIVKHILCASSIFRGPLSRSEPGPSSSLLGERRPWREDWTLTPGHRAS